MPAADFVNPEPGHYYVDALDGDRVALLVGPFRWHADALRWVGPARRLAYEVDHKAFWYAFGTSRWPDGERIGKLNARLGVTAGDLVGDVDLTGKGVEA